MFKRLLLPLDGSPLAEAAAPVAVYLARKTHAVVALLHVPESRPPRTVHGQDGQKHLQTKESAEGYLRDLAGKDLFGGIEVRWHVHGEALSDPVAGIRQYADEFSPDLVILSDHGKGRVRDVFVGNIAQQCVHQHGAPVLLLRGGPNISFPFRRILVVLRPGHVRGLPHAQELARLCSCPLELASVVAAELPGGPTAVTRELLPATTDEMLRLARQEAADFLAGEVSRLRGEGLPAEAEVLSGNAVRVVPSRAKQCGADLVVFNTHGKAGTHAFWQGSLTSKWVAKVTASVLLTPAEN